MGPIEGHLLKQCYRNGDPVPERIANAPQLFLGSQFYFEAFFNLDSERSHGMGLTQIPRSKIREYAHDLDLDDDMTDDLIYYVRQMDAANLAYLDKQNANPT